MNLTLARAIACHTGSCLVQRLDDGGVFDAPLSTTMLELGTRIWPGMIVALDGDAQPPAIRWRFETRTVDALAGDRLTILEREHHFIDRRPEDDRGTPLRVGDMVSIHFTGVGNEIEVRDTIVAGRPRHPELLEEQFSRVEAAYA